MILREALRRPSTARRMRQRLGWTALAVAALLSACTGENLFSLSAMAGPLGPQIDITAPVAGITVAVGASVVVTATVTSSEGVVSSRVRTRPGFSRA